MTYRPADNFEPGDKVYLQLIPSRRELNSYDSRPKGTILDIDRTGLTLSFPSTFGKLDEVWVTFYPWTAIVSMTMLPD